MAWVNVTNIDGPLMSLKINDTLPVDWVISPPWMPAKGGIHVYFSDHTTLANSLEITVPSTITTANGNPQTVQLAIPNINATAIGHALLNGQSILLGVKLDYGLDKTTQSAASYPRNYIDTASAVAYPQASFTGAQSSGNGSAFFVAYAKVVGDVNGDSKVNIQDLALVASSFSSKSGSAGFNSNADINYDGVIDIRDVALVAIYWGT